MVDVGNTIAAKSSQLNSDDLIGGSVTITVNKVSANESSAEQPIAIHFDGDKGKPFYPCKTMRRVLVQVWGRDGTKYLGRSMTLFREPSVKFGGIEVGGIRISHMSHIDKDVTMALTATRSSKKPYTVKVLRDAAPGKLPELTTAEYAECKDMPAFEALEEKRKSIWSSINKEMQAKLKQASDEARTRLTTTTEQTGDTL